MTTDGPISLAKAFANIAQRLADPMPDSAFCADCGLLLINLPGVQQMVIDRVGEARVPEAPTCKCVVDKAVVVRRMFTMSGVPHQIAGDMPRQFDNFKDRDGATNAYVAAHGFVDSPSVNLTLTGQTGTGKSHLAEAICRDALAKGMSVRYEYVPWLLNRIRSTFNNTEAGETVEGILAVCAQSQVLVLDDLATEKGTEWTQEQLTAIVEKRIQRHAKTVVTTNLTHAELTQKGYERLASRLWATGTHEASVVSLTCSDARITGMV
jgi:DNA replication protein DnaC